MRKFTLFLLLATSAMPALAQRSGDDRQSRRATAQAERAESRAERPQRAQRAARPERAQRDAQPQVRQDARPAPGQPVSAERMQRYQQQLQQRQQQQAQSVPGGAAQRYRQRQQQVEQRQVQGNLTREQRTEQWRQRQVEGTRRDGTLAQRNRGGVRPGPVLRPEAGQVGPVRSDVRRIGRDGRYERDGSRYDRNDRNRWSNNWRNDRRYDWRSHRNRNRSIFNLGFYFDPFGFNYRQFGIGSYLYSGYYQSNYWINDPWQYRLPPAYGPYRWVRYHNDAVLIDTYTGEVEDVIYGFFW